MTAAPRRWPAELALAGGLSVLILGPALRPGLSLVYDMVFVPRLPFTSRLLALDGSVPRAVPSDVVVAVLSRVLPIELVQKLLLLAILVGAALGTARLLRPFGRVASGVGIVVTLWNPYLGSRLLLGQWAILVAYAVLPWLVLHAARLGRAVERAERRRAAAAVVLLSALAALSPSGGVLAVATAVLVVAAGGSQASGWRSPRAAAAVLGAGIVVNLSWLVPALLRPGGLPSSSAAVGAFAARADTSLGTVLSVLTLGGTWNRETTPAGRDGAAIAAVLLAMLAVAAYGAVVVRRSPRAADWWPGLALAAAVSLLLALAASLPFLRVGARWLVVEVPGGGLFRDGTRFLPPFVLLFAVGMGVGVAALRRRAASTQLASAVALLGLLAPVVALTGLAWGGRGALAAYDYPSDWSNVRTVLAEHGNGTAVLLLPWSVYRQFPWNGGHTLYDPADRWLPVMTVGDDRLFVGGQLVPGETRASAVLTPLVESGQPLAPVLATRGVGWVLVERTTPGGTAITASALAGLTRSFTGPELELWRVPGAHAVPVPAPSAAAVVVADLVYVSCLLYAGWVSIARRTPTSRYSGRSKIVIP
jgi:hypothetical protein